MPFGLDFKSVIVGILLAYFVIPFIQVRLMALRAPKAAAQ
jgi:antibiotic biosynthesis monooxygenase (ABM) superfamily enzyme